MRIRNVIGDIGAGQGGDCGERQAGIKTPHGSLGRSCTGHVQRKEEQFSFLCAVAGARICAPIALHQHAVILPVG